MLRAWCALRPISYSAELDAALVDPPLSPEASQLVVVEASAGPRRLPLAQGRRGAFPAEGPDRGDRPRLAPRRRTPASSWQSWSRLRRRIPAGMQRTVFRQCSREAVA